MAVPDLEGRPGQPVPKQPQPQSSQSPSVGLVGSTHAGGQQHRLQGPLLAPDVLSPGLGTEPVRVDLVRLCGGHGRSAQAQQRNKQPRRFWGTGRQGRPSVSPLV